MQASTCKSKGIACAELIQIDFERCLMPCEGVFVDVKELPPSKVENENDEIFIELYKNYKKFFETSDGIN